MGKKSGYGKQKLSLILVICFYSIIIVSSVISAEPILDSQIEEEFKIQNEIRVIVKIKPDSSDWNIDKSIDEITNEVRRLQNRVMPFLSDNNFKEINKLDVTPGFYVTLNEESFTSLVNNPNIESIKLPGIIKGSLDDSISLINADDVWSSGYTGEGITVCVIDSGVNYTHSALGGCFGSGCKVKAGHDYVDDDSYPMDEHGHGTHVAGIVTSQNSIDKGVAPN